MRRTGLSLRRVEDRHDVAPAADRADRQAAAYDLSERREVRRHPDHGLRPAIAHPERRDLVEDEHDAVPGRDLAHHLGVLLSHRHAADPGGHRIDDDRGQAIRVPLDELPARLDLVEGQHHHVFHDLLGQADGIGHLRRLVGVAPALRRGAQADLDRVVAAVVGAFALRDHRPAGMGARRLDRHQHRLAPGVAEPHRLHRIDPLGDDLGELDLALGRHREAASAPDLLDDRLHHLGTGVPVDEGHVVVEAVDPLHAVRVGDPAAAARCRVDRIRREERGEPGAPARQHLARAAVEGGGPGFLVGIGHGH